MCRHIAGVGCFNRVRVAELNASVEGRSVGTSSERRPPPCVGLFGATGPDNVNGPELTTESRVSGRVVDDGTNGPGIERLELESRYIGKA